MGVQIQTRRDLARHLQAQMVASRGPWAVAFDEDKEAPGRAKVKTYLVEAHCPGGENGTLAALRSISAASKVEPTGESDLFRLASPTAEFWIDTSLGRFWRLHTTAIVADADPLHTELVSSTPWLDHVWLPPDYLEALPGAVGAQMLTFSLNHDRRPLERPDGPATEMDRFTLRLWASHAAETLLKLRTSGIFPRSVSVRSVKLHSGDDSPDGDFCIAEYFHHGKVTAGGTSFDEHSRVVVRVLRDYAELVEGIESKFGLEAAVDDQGHPVVKGDPIIIDVDWTPPDLEFAINRIFASADPFRLWGLPERVSNGHYRARAVDLHVGGVLVFDITSKRVVIQLPRRVCGNTVIRFLNNLRFHVNSDAKARG